MARLVLPRKLTSWRQTGGGGAAASASTGAEPGAGREPAPRSAADVADGGSFPVMPVSRHSARMALEQVGDDGVVDLLIGVELHLGSAVFEIQLHDRVEQVVQLAALAALAEEL